MDLNRLSTGEKIAGVSGIALILIMFIFDWFGLKVSGVAGFSAEGGKNAWGSYNFLFALILLLTGLAGAALAFMRANQQELDLPVALSAIVTGLAVVSLIIIVISIISPPNVADVSLPSGIDKTRKIGVFLGLIATIGVAYGGWTAMQEEGTSFSDQRDRLSGGGDAPPPPPPAA
jgi:hypothetical protein